MVVEGIFRKEGVGFGRFVRGRISLVVGEYVVFCLVWNAGGRHLVRSSIFLCSATLRDHLLNIKLIGLIPQTFLY